MITGDRLRELLGLAESSTVDFKKKPHRLDNEHFKSKFIKDVLAMANTPREQTAYIITGVKLQVDGSRDLLGVTDHPDDADLQDQLNLAGVDPKPAFVYQPVTVDDKSYGIIEIPLKKNGPFFATRDYGVVRAHRLYFRRGTKNDEATVAEQSDIYRWFLEEPDRRNLPESGEGVQVPHWDSFAEACCRFTRNRLYLTIVGPDGRSLGNLWSFLGRLPLSVVLDFDPRTEEGGLYSAVAPELRKSRSVHLWTVGNMSSMVPEKACYWYAARGLEGLESSLVDADWRSWNRKYGREIQGLLVELAKASGGKPLTVICLWRAREYVREVCASVDRAFGDSAEYVLAVQGASAFQDLADQFSGVAISMKHAEVLYGIAQNVGSLDGDFPAVAGVPRLDGAFHVLSRHTLNWLQEDLEVVHSNVELEIPEGRNPGYDYLRGKTVRWVDLSGHYDADREITDRLKEVVEHELRERTTSRLNLYHWPGAGGTTVARRIAWDLRRRYPAVILKRLTPRETVARFRELFSVTKLPILAIVEGADAIPDRLEQLYTEAKAENVPIVFLSVLRQFRQPAEGPRTMFLGQPLDLLECNRFLDAFARVAPERASALAKLLHRPMGQRTPFQFALTAFGRDYVGIRSYVESRLDIATEPQREILTHLAMAYYYGHKSLLSQVFASHLGHPEHIPLRLESILRQPQLELLVQEDGQMWRPAHQLLAEEILTSSLARNLGERQNWKRNLPDWATGFIRICRRGVQIPSDDLIDLMRRVFILRDEHELLGTEGAGHSHFAQLIEDIPTREGQLTVFQELVRLFPGQAHFWGHLGRFYSIAMKEYDLALDALDEAVRLGPKDPVLHHMKGMCYREKATARMRELRTEDLSAEDNLEIEDLVDRARETFAVAREIDPYQEHAYIAPVQLLLRTLDFGFAVSGCGSRADFLVSPSARRYRLLLDETENLMEAARGIREAEKPSRFLLDCQARLDQVYDDYSRALEGWNNLLEREDVYGPPVRRQIVRAYLSRRKRDWTSLDRHEVERIVQLMEDNLREEPENEHNMRLWFRAVRYSVQANINVAMDRVARWKALGDSQDAYFYLYVLHVLKAMEGSSIEAVRARDLMEQCKAKARHRRDRTRSYEWLGVGEGLGRLIHFSELGEWDSSRDFFSRTSLLAGVEGRVVEISKPEAGAIELASCDLPVFFVPAKASVQKGRDENVRVSFYLGFSYDGLRAWSVQVQQ